jgi:hypothetical protein
MQFCKAQVRAVKAKTGTDAERFYDIFRSEAVLTYRPGLTVRSSFFTPQLPRLGFQQRP